MELNTKYEIHCSDSHQNADLIARVFHEDSETLYEISYEDVNGFRLLDEHGLTDIWSSYHPNSNTFRLSGHGWYEESPLTFFMGSPDESSHIIVTRDECLEVICRDTPIIKVIDKILHVVLAD